jgi:hypothetical protein
VHRLRRQAVADADGAHPGNHMALLFDDPDRIPEPYVPLRPPA